MSLGVKRDEEYLKDEYHDGQDENDDNNDDLHRSHNRFGFEDIYEQSDEFENDKLTQLPAPSLLRELAPLLCHLTLRKGQAALIRIGHRPSGISGIPTGRHLRSLSPPPLGA